jgi:hypothetical protein
MHCSALSRRRRVPTPPGRRRYFRLLVSTGRFQLRLVSSKMTLSCRHGNRIPLVKSLGAGAFGELKLDMEAQPGRRTPTQPRGVPKRANGNPARRAPSRIDWERITAVRRRPAVTCAGRGAILRVFRSIAPPRRVLLSGGFQRNRIDSRSFSLSPMLGRTFFASSCSLVVANTIPDSTKHTATTYSDWSRL